MARDPAAIPSGAVATTSGRKAAEALGPGASDASGSAANGALGPSTEASSGSSKSGASDEDSNEGATPAIPKQCAAGQSDGVCAPDANFVKWLCGGFPKPDVALILFQKDSPWTRVYLNRNVEAWYTSGPESTKAKLMFDEEVLVLHHVKNAGGMVVNEGASEYDVLRWDGVCASLGSEEITRKRPPAPKRANIPWQRLERNVREALEKEPDILKAEIARRKECKGTTALGMMSPACVKADDKLSAAVADYVARGGQSPPPQPGH